MTQSTTSSEHAASADGWREMVQGNGEGARLKFVEALAASPESLEAQYGLAAALKLLQRAPEAITAYEKALVLAGDTEQGPEHMRVSMFKHLAQAGLDSLRGRNA
jgi:Flp pilus assembly protein TadD